MQKLKAKFRKFHMVVAVALIAVTVFLTGGDVFEGATFGVLLIDGGFAQNVYTSQTTVGEFLDELEIELHQFDRVSLPWHSEIHRGTVLVIDRAIPVNIIIDGNGEVIPFYARPDAGLATLVSDFRRVHRGHFLFDRENTQQGFEAGETINLQSVVWQTTAEDYIIPFTREYVETFTLPVGEEAVYRYGAAGTRRITYLVEYVSGQESSRDALYSAIVAQPLTEIVNVGVPLPEGMGVSACGEAFSYSRLMLMESTAYTLSVSCTGRTPDHPHWGRTASGMMAAVGIVAVDTNVIPFHTRMYIEGYGFAVAGDRGGAIRGYKIDVFFDTMAEARQWGRRHDVRVWILE
ncbi:MAG: 3D domain-containing protein [Defluviitaleaceae bacterium]|nr:3D domain-containing protein [Defluviitaleaceae bacterium]